MSGFRETPAGRIFWQRFGTGPRAGVAVHCSLAHSGEWLGVAERLKRQITMTAIDLPGHGRSDDWPGGGGYIAAAAKVVLDFAAAKEAPIDLIGHSAGAVASLRAATLRPEAFRTLTLIEPVFFAAAQGRPGLRQHQADMAPFEAAWAAGRADEATRVFLSLWGAGEEFDALPKRQRDYALARIRLVPEASGELEADAGGLLTPGRIEAVRCPTMLISGGASPGVIHDIADALADRIPDAVVREVDGARHMLPVTHPDEVARLIAENLARA